MFTGIVEETGTVERVVKGEKSSRIRIKASVVLNGTRTGDSISTNGVCLTVAKLEKSCFEADVMGETLRRSNLGRLTAGSRVNLERAVCCGGRFGGHMVSGHIDGTGRIKSILREDNAVWISISAPESLLRYVVEKGSVAVDGVSLTVATVDREGFKVSVIPHTGRETTLLQRNPGDWINLECDIIGKYVEKLLGSKKTALGPGEIFEEAPALTETLLKEYGF